jgi:hypothetical protein
VGAPGGRNLGEPGGLNAEAWLDHEAAQDAGPRGGRGFDNLTGRGRDTEREPLRDPRVERALEAQRDHEHTTHERALHDFDRE